MVLWLWEETRDWEVVSSNPLDCITPRWVIVTLICCKIVLLLEKNENNKNKDGMGPLKKVETIHLICLTYQI